MLRLMLSLPADDGSVAIEYALIAAMISVAILTGLQAIGQDVSREFLGVVAYLTP